MRKILYLHGLSAPQGGKKVDFLSSIGLVYAPSIDYTNAMFYEQLLYDVKLISPDLIIGSSMGGYTAYQLATIIDIPVLLFNPAMENQSIDVSHIYSGDLKPTGKAVIGMKDKVVDPENNIKLLSSLDMSISIMTDMGHRIPYDVFVKHVNRMLIFCK